LDVEVDIEAAGDIRLSLLPRGMLQATCKAEVTDFGRVMCCRRSWAQHLNKNEPPVQPREGTVTTNCDHIGAKQICGTKLAS
jgi:hypothetical protein